MARRSVFFAVAAAICLVLVPLSDRELRWVPIATAVAYGLFAVLSSLDAISRARAPEWVTNGEEETDD
jgi:hypothetical protein